MSFIDYAYASSEETHESIATEPADTGLLASMGINGSLFIFQLINFAIVFVVLWFLILKPLTKKLLERQKMIDNSIANSKKIDDMLKQSELGFQEKIDMAKAEASMIMERTKNEADTLAEQSRQKTRVEIESLVESAKKKIGAERDQMIIGLKEETASIVVAALERILSEKIDAKKDKEMIAEALNKLNYEKK
ncbi:MAG: ATP synthase F0 subunit B [Patescibacteria group bacterium]